MEKAASCGALPHTERCALIRYHYSSCLSYRWSKKDYHWWM